MGRSRSPMGMLVTAALVLAVAVAAGYGAFVSLRSGPGTGTVTAAAPTSESSAPVTPSVPADASSSSVTPAVPSTSVTARATTSTSAGATVPAGATRVTGSPSGSTRMTPRPTPSAHAHDDLDGEALGGPDAADTLASALSAADRAAGLLSPKVAQSARGTLHVVPGEVRAPGRGSLKRVRIEVENGLELNDAAFAATVMKTLNDPRGWGHGGRMTFSRVSGAADIRVVLASPDTSARMCRPLRTYGKLSCRSGNTAILTMYRWVNGIPDYGRDRVNYRNYLVNHEVGHVLGHGHEYCPGAGRRAPVMMQQTKGLRGCTRNAWPFP